MKLNHLWCSFHSYGCPVGFISKLSNTFQPWKTLAKLLLLPVLGGERDLVFGSLGRSYLAREAVKDEMQNLVDRVSVRIRDDISADSGIQQ